MHWVQNTHVRRYHQHYHSGGHIWQGRFKAFPIEQDEHLLTVLRYAEGQEKGTGTFSIDISTLPL
jgi:putative transposase